MTIAVDARKVAEELAEHLRVIMGSPLEEDRGLTKQEAADFLGYVKSTLDRLVGQGEIPTYGTGKKTRIRLSALKAYQKRNERYGA